MENEIGGQKYRGQQVWRGITNASYGGDMVGTGQDKEGNNWQRVRKSEMPETILMGGCSVDNGLIKKEKMGAVGVSLDNDALSQL